MTRRDVARATTRKKNTRIRLKMSVRKLQLPPGQTPSGVTMTARTQRAMTIRTSRCISTRFFARHGVRRAETTLTRPRTKTIRIEARKGRSS